LIGNILARRGVYPGMFEQSLLADYAGTRKTATFAASLTAQILIAGVLVVTPLFYHDVLPAWRLPSAVPALAMWHPPEPPISTPHPGVRSSALSAPTVFRPSVTTHSDSSLPALIILDYDAPTIAAAPGISALPIGASTLPRFESRTASGPAKPNVQVPETPVRVGGDVQAARLIRRVVPVYPRPAGEFRISGTVHLLGIIAKDGTIQRLQVLSGHPLLRQAALEAVSQWIYRPTILNGQPVEVEAPIDVIFTLR
jgi:periplasmic protein TonB